MLADIRIVLISVTMEPFVVARLRIGGGRRDVRSRRGKLSWRPIASVNDDEHVDA